MKINKLNYENYVIDYIEGTLSVELKRDFDLFLEKNNDVYEEIKDYMSAPIYEESEEIFANKKAVLQKNKLGKYALLALIPIILLGAYFIMYNNNEIKTENKAQVENVEVKQRSEKRDVGSEMPDARSEMREAGSEMRDAGSEMRDAGSEMREAGSEMQEAGSEPKLKKENFELKKIAKPSDSELRFAAVEIDKEIKKEELSLRPVLNTPSAIGNLKFGVNHNYQRIAKSNMVIAEVKKFDGSEEQKENRNIGWLEMITPASFEDIDLKESLAIQSNKEIDSRKILNAFIPDTVVK